MNNSKTLEEVVSIPGLLDDLASTKNAEDLQHIFEKYSLRLEDGCTYEDAFASIQRGISDGKEEELSEADLEQVAGGFGLTAVLVVGGIIILGPPIAYGIGRLLGRRLAKIA